MGLGARGRRERTVRPEPGLGGPRAAGALRHALFFALVPGADDARRFAELAAGLLKQGGLRARPRPASLLHLSLFGLGAGPRLSEAVVARGLEVGAAVRRRRFDVVFDAALSFGAGPGQPLVLGCTPGSAAALNGLRDALGDAGQDLGFGAYRSGVYVPHLTVAYAQAAAPETVLQAAVRWRPGEIVLVHSIQGAGRHVRLGAWPLLD